MEALKITGIDVTDYMGIEHESFPVGSQGVEFSGEIGAGKSSLMKAVLAGAKGGEFAKAEYIRNGAKKAVVLIKMGDSKAIQLTMRHSGNELVTDGFGLGEKRARLKSIFSPIDPLEFWMAKEDDRQKQILAAMPCEVFAREMSEWTLDQWSGSVDGHGLEVVAKARKEFYAKRTEAKKVAKKSADNALAKKAEADELAAKATGEYPLEADAKKALEVATARAAALANRKQQAREQEARTKGTREKVAELRAKAEELRSNPDAVAPMASRVWGMAAPILREIACPNPEEESFASTDVVLSFVESAMVSLENQIKVVRRFVASVTDTISAAQKLEEKACEVIGQADDLEAAIAGLQIEAPTYGEEAEAGVAVIKAEDDLAGSRAVIAAQDALALLNAAQEEADLDAKRVTDLETIVENLTTVAPAALAARTEMIPGVVITDEGITVDGKLLKLLSGGESMFFAVDLAKRAKAECKLLTVDELGRMNPAAIVEFVKLCVADDWQLIATHAKDGKLVVEQIEVE
jgi:hypothetical protein